MALEFSEMPSSCRKVKMLLSCVCSKSDCLLQQNDVILQSCVPSMLLCSLFSFDVKKKYASPLYERGNPLLQSVWFWPVILSGTLRVMEPHGARVLLSGVKAPNCSGCFAWSLGLCFFKNLSRCSFRFPEPDGVVNAEISVVKCFGSFYV